MLSVLLEAGQSCDCQVLLAALHSHSLRPSSACFPPHVQMLAPRHQVCSMLRTILWDTFPRNSVWKTPRKTGALWMFSLQFAGIKRHSFMETLNSAGCQSCKRDYGWIIFFFFKSITLFLPMCMSLCLYVSMCICTQVPAETRRECRSSELGVTRGCEPPDVGTGN